MTRGRVTPARSLRPARVGRLLARALVGTVGGADAPGGLDEVVGQSHLLQAGSPLRRLVEGSGAASVILYGPPGTGKTTLASLISQATGRRFEALSALSAGVKGGPRRHRKGADGPRSPR